MKLLSISALAAVLLKGLGGPSGEVDNPEYASWSTFSVGSSVTFQGTREEDGLRMEYRTTYTLVSLTAKEATVASHSVRLLDDGQAELPGGKLIIRARISESARRALRDLKAVISVEGNERLQVRGSLLVCHWTRLLWKEDGTNVSFKVWSSPEIPGGIVRTTWQLSGSSEATCDSKVIAWMSNDP
jgi:hypothetical protein